MIDAYDGDIRFQRTILPGGVRLLTEHIPGQKSVALGLWSDTGSRDEAPGREGSTHFLEHLVFKGTQNRSNREISELSDWLGGDINAMTAKQYTCYHGRVFSEDLPVLLSLLVDMVTRPRLDAADMDVERGVIVDELAMYADDTDSVAHEAIVTDVVGSHPIGRPTGGTKESVMSLEHSALLDHWSTHYRPSQLVVTAAGEVDHAELADLLMASLRTAGWDLDEGAVPAARRSAGDIEYPAPGARWIERDTEQASVVVGYPGIPAGTDRSMALTTLNAVLGGGMSSRLFQTIREDRGLAYSVYSYGSSWREGGMFAMAAGCSPAMAETVKDMMVEVLTDFLTNGPRADELDSAWRRIRMSLVTEAERNSARRQQLGIAELVTGRRRSVAESLAQARAVTADDVMALAHDLAAGPQHSVIVGPRP